MAFSLSYAQAMIRKECLMRREYPLGQTRKQNYWSWMAAQRRTARSADSKV